MSFENNVCLDILEVNYVHEKCNNLVRHLHISLQSTQCVSGSGEPGYWCVGTGVPFWFFPSTQQCMLIL